MKYFPKNNLEPKLNIYQEVVIVPMGDWVKNRLKNLSTTDKKRDNAKNGGGFGKNVSNWVDRKMTYPTNVLHLATERNNKNHSAAFLIHYPSGLLNYLL